MSEKNDAVAESIIRCEGLSFALAAKVGKEGDLREARAMLKDRKSFENLGVPPSTGRMGDDTSAA